MSEQITVDRSQVYWQDRFDPFGRIPARTKFNNIERDYLALLTVAAERLTGQKTPEERHESMRKKFQDWESAREIARKTLIDACGKITSEVVE